MRFVCPTITEPMPGRPGAVRIRPAIFCNKNIPFKAEAIRLDENTHFVLMDVPDGKLLDVMKLQLVKIVENVRTSTDIPENRRQACLRLEQKAVNRMRK